MPIVLGYHGCDIKTAQALLGGSSFEISNNNYDWLGSGAYFWEWDVLRAYHWAKECKGELSSVVGAVIELGNCLDLTTQGGIQAVEAAYSSYANLQRLRNKPMLENKDAKAGKPGNLALRLLDRAVITHLHESNKGAEIDYDTVRALLPEGEELYPNAGFWKKTHVQIAVRKINQIRGVFRVPQNELKQLNISEAIYHF
ncbi:MAG: hypothetical protein WBD10_02035 [Acidobacteriaceae bacterium]